MISPVPNRNEPNRRYFGISFEIRILRYCILPLLIPYCPKRRAERAGMILSGASNMNLYFVHLFFGIHQPRCSLYEVNPISGEPLLFEANISNCS